MKTVPHSVLFILIIVIRVRYLMMNVSYRMGCHRTIQREKFKNNAGGPISAEKNDFAMNASQRK